MKEVEEIWEEKDMSYVDVGRAKPRVCGNYENKYLSNVTNLPVFMNMFYSFSCIMAFSSCHHRQP